MSYILRKEIPKHDVAILAWHRENKTVELDINDFGIVEVNGRQYYAETGLCKILQEMSDGE